MESGHILEIQGEAYPLKPDFVEERTLLSARRVVPLEQVETTRRSRRTLLLIGALVISLVLGACTSLAIVYLERRQTQQIDRISDQAALTRTDGTEPSPSLLVDKEVAPDVPGVTPKAKQGNKVSLVQGSNVISKRTAPLAGESSHQDAMVSPVGAENRNDLEMNREVRGEERRPRRAAVRSDRSRGNGDDLFRIREIFEGRPRPD